MKDTAGKWLWGGVAAMFILMVGAIIFPVFQKVREGRDPESFCPSNMKQLGLALVQYSQDYDEKMPNIASPNGLATWRSAILPFVQQRDIFQCPTRPNKDTNSIGRDGFSQDYSANYSGNYGKIQPDQGEGAFAGQGSQPLSVNDFSSPATLIIILETENNN